MQKKLSVQRGQGVSFYCCLLIRSSRSCCVSQGSSEKLLDINTWLSEDFWGLSFKKDFFKIFFPHYFFSLSILFLGIFKQGSSFFSPLAYFLNPFFSLHFFLSWLDSWGPWVLDSFEMLSSCFYHLRGRGLLLISGPTPMEQEVEVEVDGGLVSVSKPAAASPAVWASPAFLFRLVLSLALLVFPCPAVAARVSSSLSTTHHVHHFHNKHGTVPIAINRMPFLTRGGHGKTPFFDIPLRLTG